MSRNYSKTHRLITVDILDSGDREEVRSEVRLTDAACLQCVLALEELTYEVKTSFVVASTKIAKRQICCRVNRELRPPVEARGRFDANHRLIEVELSVLTSGMIKLFLLRGLANKGVFDTPHLDIAFIGPADEPKVNGRPRIRGNLTIVVPRARAPLTPEEFGRTLSHDRE